MNDKDSQTHTKSSTRITLLNIPIQAQNEDLSTAGILLSKIHAGASTQECMEFAENLVDLVKANNIIAIHQLKIITYIINRLRKNKIQYHQAAVHVLSAFLKSSISDQVEPYIPLFLHNVLKIQTDKDNPGINAAAELAMDMILSANPYSTPDIVSVILDVLKTAKKVKLKNICLNALGAITKQNTTYFDNVFPEMIEGIFKHITVKSLSRKTAIIVMEDICSMLNNKEVKLFFHSIITSTDEPELVPEISCLMSDINFIEEPDVPTLAVLVPSLRLCLGDERITCKYAAASLIYKMCSMLVNHEKSSFIVPVLQHSIEEAITTTEDEECCEMLRKALDAVICIKGNDQVIAARQEMEEKYTSRIAISLCAKICYSKEVWLENIARLFKNFLVKESAIQLTLDILEKCHKTFHPEPIQEKNTKTILCNNNVSFSSRNGFCLIPSHLIIERGKRYALCGARGCGKSSFLSSIIKKNVRGFPISPDIKIVCVDYSDDIFKKEIYMVDLMLQVKDRNTDDRIKIVQFLKNYDFSDQDIGNITVNNLTKPYKMKLALARAMFGHPDIVLLDEPTHVFNVIDSLWLEKILCTFNNVAFIIASKDHGFLKMVCTDTIYYKPNHTLEQYNERISDVVKKFSTAVPYCYTENRSRLNFPEPRTLTREEHKQQAIVEFKNVSIDCPITNRCQLSKMNLQCSLYSRVAILGLEESDKSTILNLITSVISSTTGSIYRHCSLNIVSITKQYFINIEKHHGKTPVEYIQWRFMHCKDAEEDDDSHMVIKNMSNTLSSKEIYIGEKKGHIQNILGRRKINNECEYEVYWVNRHQNGTAWIARKELEDYGLIKWLVSIDKKHMEEDNYGSSLSNSDIKSYLDRVGLGANISAKYLISELTNTQKVVLVFAAALWSRPQLLILDSPMLYLNQESIQILIHALNNYKGGVIFSTNNRKFVEPFCSEFWRINKNLVNVFKNKEAPKEHRSDSKYIDKADKHAISANIAARIKKYRDFENLIFNAASSAMTFKKSISCKPSCKKDKSGDHSDINKTEAEAETETETETESETVSISEAVSEAVSETVSIS
ncbi:P-loop containing nucleoside triphosphate hydrolase protein, partial [Spinellus fusiger]